MMKKWFHSLLYVMVCMLSLALALFLSSQIMSKSVAQSPPLPPSGDLPPEFLNETTQRPGSEAPQALPTPSPSGAEAAQTPAPPATAPSSSQTEVAAPALLPIEENLVDMLPSPSNSATDGYVYDPTGRRDPFRPYALLRNMAVNEKREEIPLEPLQKFDIDQLRIVGILWEVKKPKAMIKDPTGTLHVVLRNAKIGRNDGYIAAIREGEIIVIESFNSDNKVIKTSRVMAIKK